MTSNSRTIVAAVLVTALVSSGASWLIATRSPSATPQSQTVSKAGAPGAAAAGVPVEAIKVAMLALPQGITAVGSLRSDESVIVRSEIGGRITEILFREGQRAAKGQLLFRLDGSVTAAELAQARANLVLNKSKYERAIDLKEKGFISQQARDEAENNLRVAEASVQLSRARLDKTEIRAPFAGIIGLRQVSIGDYVKDGQDLVNLESVDALKADFRVPEIYLSQVREGQSMQIALDAFPGKTYQASVFAINPLVDQSGRALVIRARVTNVDGALRPGMFARVRLLFSQTKPVMVIPEQALVPSGSEQFVFKIVDGKAQRTKVETGQRTTGAVEIVAGLAENDVVVTAGQMKLREGVAVRHIGTPARVADEVPPPPRPAAGAASGGDRPATRTARQGDPS